MARVGAILLWAGVSLLESAAVQSSPVERWSALASPVFRVVASRTSGFEGLPQTELPMAVAQDATGFLWVATEAGLERWDGYEIRTYAPHTGDPCALGEDSRVLLVDDRNRLWAGGMNGLARYDPQTDCFHTITAGPNALAGGYVAALANDGAGGLWVGTTVGLDHLEPDLTHVTHVDVGAGDQIHHSPMPILRLLRDRDGALWVGTDIGLHRRGPTDTAFSVIPLSGNDSVSSQVHALLQSADGRIWVGTGTGRAYLVDPSTLKVRELTSVGQIRDVGAVWGAAEAANGEIWLATHGSGIVIVDPQSLQARVLRHQKGVPTSLLQDSVEALFRDHTGLMWVTCFKGFGYYQASPATAAILTVDAVNGLPDGAVNSMVQLADDRIAIGQPRQISVIGPASTAAEPIALEPDWPVDGVFALATPNGRDLFAGIRPLGLVWIDRGRGRSYRLPLPGPQPVPRVYSLAMEGERLWVGSREGVWSVVRGPADDGAQPPWRAEKYFDAPRVFAIAVAPDGTKWFGGPNGLLRLGVHSDAPVHMPLTGETGERLADPFILALHIDRRDRLWVSTTLQGSFLVDTIPGTDGSIRVRKHFSYNGSALLEDAAGTIWGSTDDGVMRIDPDSLVVRLLGRGDGIIEKNFWNGSAAATSEGELLFGGESGIALLRPRWTEIPRQPAPLVITGITVGSRSVPIASFNQEGGGRVLEVPADAQSLSVTFAALDYASPELHAFAYRLDGYDRDWIRTGIGNRLARYTNLAPGRYRLRVQGTDLTGAFAGPERQIPIQVAAAWYQTMAFHAVEALLVLMVLVSIVQARTVVLRTRQRELESQVEERTQALVRVTGARNSLIENLAHDLRTPLTSLRGYLDRLSVTDDSLTDADRGRFIRIAARQAERLIRLVGELFELVRLDDPLASLSLERFSPAEVLQDVVLEFGSIAEGQRIVCEIDRAAENELITGDISLFQRLIDNLVDNAVSHTPPGGTVTVRLGVDERHVILEVSDTGRGIQRADLERIFDRYERGDTTGRMSGAGLGLAIVKRILELHDGSIAVDSEVGMGARFTVRLPRKGPTAASPAPS